MTKTRSFGKMMKKMGVRSERERGTHTRYEIIRPITA